MVAEVPVRLLHNTRTQAALVASGAVVGYARLESLASSVKITTEDPASVRIRHAGRRRADRDKESLNALVLADDQRRISVEVSCEHARVHTE